MALFLCLPGTFSYKDISHVGLWSHLLHYDIILTNLQLPFVQIGSHSQVLGFRTSTYLFWGLHNSTHNRERAEDAGKRES